MKPTFIVSLLPESTTLGTIRYVGRTARALAVRCSGLWQVNFARVVRLAQLLRSRRTEDEIECQPQRLRERVEEDRRDDHERHADILEQISRDVRPREHTPEDEPEHERQLDDDDVEHHPAEEVVLAFLSLERQPACRAPFAHMKPRFENATAAAVRAAEPRGSGEEPQNS